MWNEIKSRNFGVLSNNYELKSYKFGLLSQKLWAKKFDSLPFNYDVISQNVDLLFHFNIELLWVCFLFVLFLNHD